MILHVFSSDFIFLPEKYVKTTNMMILTIQQSAKHPFAGWYTQHGGSARNRTKFYKCPWVSRPLHHNNHTNHNSIQQSLRPGLNNSCYKLLRRVKFFITLIFAEAYWFLCHLEQFDLSKDQLNLFDVKSSFKVTKYFSFWEWQPCHSSVMVLLGQFT